ncbi:MAG: hypothetical protein AABY16_03365 [Nanoarchaeota archaeon]
MKRLGELSSQQIVVIVLALGAFIIAALFLFGVFNNEDLTERELCRLSILERATVPNVAAQAIPIQCTTEKICITADKNFIEKVKDVFTRNPAAIGATKKSDCKQFAGEENVREVKVKIDSNPSHQAETVKAIEREVANAMYDCWVMTGQGKMDIGTPASGSSIEGKLANLAVEEVDLSVSEINPICIVCSRLAFSDALIEADKNLKLLDRLNYNDFMSREVVPRSSLTYLQTFTDESVGAGYGAVSQSEGLNKYIGKDIGDAELAEIKETLRKQFEDKLNEKISGTEITHKDYIDGLTTVKVKNLLDDISRVGYSRDNQLSIVFTQIKVPSINPNDQFWNTFKSGAVVGSLGAVSGPGKIASFFIPGPGWVKALIKIGTIGATSWGLAASAEDTSRKNQALSAAVCGTFQSKNANQQGCSLVKLVNWDFNTINNLCVGGIEGNL